MILKMQRLTLIGFKEEKEAILKQLMKNKCVQIEEPEDIKDYDKIRQLSTQGNAETYDLEQEQAKFAAAIKAVGPYSAKAKKEIMSFGKLLDKDVYSKSVALREQISEVEQKTAEIKSLKSRDSFIISSLEPWSSLDLNLDTEHTSACSIMHLIIPAVIDLSDLESKMQEATKLCYIKEISKGAENRYITLVFHNSARDDVMELLKSYNTTRPDFSGIKGTATENIAALKAKLAEYDKDLENCENQLKTLANDTALLKTGFDMAGLQIDTQNARQKLFDTEQVFAFSGWIVADDAAKIKKLLEKFNCYFTLTDPAEGEEPPVKLKNSKFAKPYELITEMYSLPAPSGIDPDAVMAPFFILFFGMMLADGAYGIIILLASLIALKTLKPEEGFLSNMLHMGVGCGISTIFWGAMYGGWFGNLVTQVAESWFGATVTIPAVLDPLNDPMSVMILSFILGAIHLFVGMGVKAYLLIKRGHALSAIFDIGFWYILLIGLPLLVIPATATVGKYMAIGGAVGLILTQGRHEKNIFMKLIKGVMSLYDITSYLSDVLSYARILALGLAGGVIANVINIMGTLPGFNIIGVIAFVLIFAGGHIFNLAISGLGAYVHTSRLQYVEFFGKFYEEGGRPFKPFKANTKYTLISDKEDF